MTREARLLQIITSLAISAVGLAIVLLAFGFPPTAQLIPSIVGSALAVLALINAFMMWRTPIGAPEQPDAEGDLGGLALVTTRAPLVRFGTIAIGSALILPGIWLAGYPIATSLYIFVCLISLARMSLWPTLALALANFVIVYAFLQFAVNVPPFSGVLFFL
jgi:hypothetical protein